PGTAYGPKNDPVEGFVTLRWLMPAVVTGAALCAVAVRSIGRWGILLVLGGLAAVIDGIDRGPGVSSGAVLTAALALAALAAAGMLATRWSNRRRPRLTGIRAIALATAALAAVVAVGRREQT